MAIVLCPAAAPRRLHALALAKYGYEPAMAPQVIDPEMVAEVAEQFGVTTAALRVEYGARFDHLGLFHAEALHVGQRVATSLGLGTIAGFEHNAVAVMLDKPRAVSGSRSARFWRWAVSGDNTFNEFGSHG